MSSVDNVMMMVVIKQISDTEKKDERHQYKSD